MSERVSVPEAEGKLPAMTRFYFALGACAYGVKNNGLLFFLLGYYNLALGLTPELAGIAIMVALIIDGISDPIVGYISDHWHSRWKRRHPFMYFSAVPVLISYYFLWHPPEFVLQSQAGLFAHLLIFAILVRLFVTFYETPSTSLIPEMVSNYHDRTRLLSMRYFFGWASGLTMSLLAYTIFFQPDLPDYPDGRVNPEAYQQIGFVGSIIIFATIMVSSLGTHHVIPKLRAPVGRASSSLRIMLREIRETLASRSFLALFFAAIFAAMGGGLASALSLYLFAFFWELSVDQITLLVIGNFLSAFAALAVTTSFGRLWGKKKAAILIATAAFLLMPLAVFLRLLDILPSNDAAALFFIDFTNPPIPITPLLLILIIGNTIDVMLIISASILITSMLSDLVEDNEVKTGRRSEGLFFAARSFILKSVAGAGILVSTIILALAGFPRGATPGDIAPEIVYNFGLIYAPTLLVVYLLSICCLIFYRIDQKQHEANLSTLKKRVDSA